MSSGDEIRVEFTYESQYKETLICKPDEEIKKVCQKFFKQRGIDLNKVVILLKGSKLEQSDYNNPIRKYISSIDGNCLPIIAYKIETYSTIIKNSIKQPKIPDTPYINNVKKSNNPSSEDTNGNYTSKIPTVINDNPNINIIDMVIIILLIIMIIIMIMPIFLILVIILIITIFLLPKKIITLLS